MVAEQKRKKQKVFFFLFGAQSNGFPCASTCARFVLGTLAVWIPKK